MVPLTVDGEFAGTVELGDAAVRDFDREIGVVRGFAEIATQALKVAAFVEKLAARDRAARELVEVSSLASQATASDELLRGVTRRLSSAIEASGCDIYGAAGDTLVVVASARRGERDDELLGAAYELDEYPAAAAAIATREPLIVTDADDPRLTASEAARFRANGFVAECTLPLFSGETMVGILDIFDDQSADFLEYLDLMKGVGQIVADSLVKTGLLTDLGRQNKLMSELVELGAIAPGASDVGAAFSSLGSRLIDTIDADTCELYSLNGERIELLAAFDREGTAEQWIGWTGDLGDFPRIAESLSGHEVLIIASSDDPRLSARERERYAEFDYQSEICVPLVVDGRPVGFLDIYDTRPRDYVEFADFLRGFAPVLARTTQNGLLLRELERRNVALRDLVKLGELVTLVSDVSELLRLTALRLLVTLDAVCCDVYRIDGGDLVQLVSVGAEGFNDDDNGWRAPLSHYPGFAAALEQGEPWVIASPDDPRLSDYEVDWYRRWGLKSSLSIPLVVNGKAIAVIDIEDSRERSFAEHLDFMRSVGQLLAGAFEKALLLERLEDGNRELRQLVDAGLEFGASLEMDDVLRSVATRMRVAAEAACCDIYSFQGDREVGLASIEADDTADLAFAGTVYRIDDMNITRLAMERRQPVAVTDMDCDGRASELERAEWRRFGFRSGLVIPLVTRAEVVGFAEVFDDKVRDFDRVPVLHGLAQIAAQALSNAALHAELEETAGRMTLMTEASLEFSSSLDLQDTLAKVGRRLSAAVDVPHCDIELVRDDGTTYRLMSVAHGAVQPARIGASLDLSEHPSRLRALETREPVVVASIDDPRLTDESRAANRALGEKSWLTVPLVAKDRVIGLVDLVETRQERTFSEQEIGAATAICRVAAMAIDNADLYDSLAATNRETEMLNAIAREAAASLDVGEIARAATEQLRRLVPFETSVMVLIDDDRLHVVHADETERPFARELEGLPVADAPAAFREALLRRPGHRVAPARRQPPRRGTPRARRRRRGRPGRPHPRRSPGRRARAARLAARRLRRARHPARSSASAPILPSPSRTPASTRTSRRMHLSNLKALSSALNAKDYYTLGHAARVSAYMVLLGSRARLAEGAGARRRRSRLPARHRQDRHLRPRAAQAGQAERRRSGSLMRQHPVFSADIIRRCSRRSSSLGVRHHHERCDGGGYPDGLRRRGDPPDRARHVRRRLLRRHVVPAALPASAHVRRVPRGAAALQRPAVRPGDHRRSFCECSTARGAPPGRRRRRRAGGGPHRPRQARRACAGREDEESQEYPEIAAVLRERARCQPADGCI